MNSWAKVSKDFNTKNSRVHYLHFLGFYTEKKYGTRMVKLSNLFGLSVRHTRLLL